MSAFDLSASELGDLRAAWRELRIEWTRTLFGIASAGVGLSTGAIFAADTPRSIFVSGLLLLAGIAFGALAFICFFAIERSADLILHIVQNKPEPAAIADHDLRRTLKWQKVLATSGIAAIFLAAFVHTCQGTNMSDYEKSPHASAHNFSGMLALYNRQTPAPPAAKPTDTPQPDSTEPPELNEREEKN